MNKVINIAVREFVATVFTKAFIMGLLIMPLLITLGVLLGPRLFNFRNFQVQGDIAIIDPTGAIAAELRTTLDARRIAARRAEDARRALADAPQSVRQIAGTQGKSLQTAMGPAPDIQLIERPADADVQAEKAWLHEAAEDRKRLALVVIHPDAAVRAEGKPDYGTFDLYVATNLDDRADSEIQQSIREAIINARVRERFLDRETLDALVRVPRVRSVIVTKENEQRTVGGFTVLLPAAFGALLFIGVVTGGQALVTSTVEEKSNRVIEVLLSAVSPMQLMAGKLLGQMAASLIALGIYLGMGMLMLTTFALLGLLDPWLILYLLIFFFITYLVFGSLLMAVGAAVNDMREAQSMMMPIMIVLMVPWLLWMPISRDPNSTFSIALSFIPPVNTFAMMLRMASSAPPALWQVWLTIAIGVGSVFAAIWFAAKVFRIGLLMYGKPPNLATLIRWVRAA